MKTYIKVKPGPNGFAEDKEEAKKLRKGEVLPSLEDNRAVVLDFSDVKYATQSYVHALIGEALQKHKESILDKIEFKNCSPSLRSVIALVVDYSLGGFPKLQEPRRVR
jgi:hypothetical protein